MTCSLVTFSYTISYCFFVYCYPIILYNESVKIPLKFTRNFIYSYALHFFLICWTLLYHTNKVLSKQLYNCLKVECFNQKHNNKKLLNIRSINNKKSNIFTDSQVLSLVCINYLIFFINNIHIKCIKILANIWLVIFLDVVIYWGDKCYK